jgi:tubulin polyglutamylase TTLL4
MKPTNAACGRGIKMIKKDSKIRNKKDMLVSEYITNPHLINNLKYDLRIYVLVTSYDPLRVYMFKEGLTRFATY